QTKMGRPHKASVGRRVAVIGAGNTAMGVLVALKRLGAETTHLIYRRSKEEMPAFKHEYEFAKEHGVIFHWEAQPRRSLGKNGTIITNEYQTGNEKYFAGGDCAHGAKLVVDAVASGKAAARSLDAWLGNPRGIPEEFGSPASWTPLSAPPQAPEHPAI